MEKMIGGLIAGLIVVSIFLVFKKITNPIILVFKKITNSIISQDKQTKIYDTFINVLSIVLVGWAFIQHFFLTHNWVAHIIVGFIGFLVCIELIGKGVDFFKSKK